MHAQLGGAAAAAAETVQRAGERAVDFESTVGEGGAAVRAAVLCDAPAVRGAPRDEVLVEERQRVGLQLAEGAR
eukprot:6213844-Pleurochrysis_carterae.AAC.3